MPSARSTIATTPAASAASAPRTRNGRAARPALSVEAIVDAACELIAESHADQLTMRRLSERLGVALGATYHYVPDRDSLLVLVSERIQSQIKLVSRRPSDWAIAVRQLVIEYANAYAAYPGMAAFANQNLAATGPDQERLGLIDLLIAAGFEPDSARVILAALLFYTSGATATRLIYRDQPGYPAAVMAQQFEAGLDVVIEGARARLRADRRARRG